MQHHDHRLQHVADLLGRDPSAIAIHFECSDHEKRWFAWITAENQREHEEYERDLDTADRLGLRMPDDDAHGNLVAICEGCRQDWRYGLEVVGGAALCQPCIDALDGGLHG